jgi:hypothetical protein
VRVRHLTASANVAPDGSLIDPFATRHGLLVGGRVAALAGPVDPLTHLNADFEQHGLEQVVVVEALVVGAPALFSDDGLRFAFAADQAYLRHGPVDLAARLRAWQAAHAASRAAR